MLELKFTDKEKEQLYYERFNHPHPRVQLKMEVVWLKSQGLSHQEIASLSGVCRNTVIKYIREYVEGGIDKLKEVRFYRPKSKLENHQKTIKEYKRKKSAVDNK